MEELNIDTSNPELHTVKLVVSSEEVDGITNEVATKLQPVVMVDGFRKGSAPLQSIKDKYANMIRGEASAQLVNVAMNKALKKLGTSAGILPVVVEKDRPSPTRKWIGNFELDGTYNVTVEYAPPPPLKPTGYIGVPVEIDSKRPDRWVQKQLEMLQYGTASDVSVQRPAAVPDTVIMDISSFESGIPVKGGQLNKFVVQLGEDKTSYLGKTLFDMLVGKSAGDEFEFTEKMDDKHPDRYLAGKDLLFKVKVLDVKELIVPAIDDDLARGAKFKDLNDLISQLKSEWNKKFKLGYKGGIYKQIREAIVAANPFPLPAKWLEQECVVTAQRMNMNWKKEESNPKTSAIIKEFAEMSVRSNYVLQCIIEENKIAMALTNDDLLFYAGEEVIDSKMSAQDHLAMITRHGQYDAFVSQAKQLKALDWILTKAQITDKATTEDPV